MVWNTDLIAELVNLLIQACQEMCGAKNRHKSRGAKEDYPDVLVHWCSFETLSIGNCIGLGL